jgi:pimeloyl-ACP methyl ester carboxylesterase
MRQFSIIRMTSTLLFAVIMGAATQAHAERAASIEYEVVGRPAELPQSFNASAGATLRFLAIKAIDGFRVNAALWQPANKEANATTLIISVHGSGDNFAKPPIGFLSPALVAKGYGVLGINTRQHDDKVNTDSFLEVRRDIEAAVYTARALGYRSIVLHGHSLGNIQVQYYAANNWDADIKAIVLSSAFGNLPWKSRHLLVQNEDNFRQLIEVAFKALRDGKLTETLPVRMNWITGQQVPLTSQHFLTYRLESSSTADGTYWIKRVPKPILVVRDAGDAIVQSFEPIMLVSAATSSGSLVPNIKYVLLPNPKGISPAAHFFVDNQQALIDTLAGWLAEQRL